MKAKKTLRCVEKSIINSVFIVFFLVFGVKSLDKERKSCAEFRINFLFNAIE